MGLSNFFLNKIQMADLKKTIFFQKCQFSIFFTQLSSIGPWVSRIDGCKGQYCDSTDMVVRLSYLRPKTVKNTFFVFFPVLGLMLDSLTTILVELH
jgi:hypothetical protein